MNIIYYGLTCFRIQSNNLSLLIDPVNSQTGVNLPRMQNDIVLLSQSSRSRDFSDKTFVIDCPGEYELKDCFIYGIPVNNGDQEEKIVFLIEFEGVRIAYLGLIKNSQLTQSQLERLEDADVLILPVGGGEALNEKQAVELVGEIEPRLVIPMNYQLPGLKVKLESVDKFKKELGAKSEEVDKLKVAKKDLPQEETRLVIIKPLT
jgi:L-ascorbate metabolism protein UlaG (beta-lactamase superfamily)